MERQRGVTLRFLAEPKDVNFGGKVHGGAVMKWIDQAGYTCAAGWTGTYCVTVYMGGLHFLAPIHVGELVELHALVIRTGRSSIDISVDVYARDPKSPERRRTGHCVIVFVALGADGRPARVPQWQPRDDVDRSAHQGALDQRTSLQRARQLLAPEALHPRPQPDVRGRGVLGLDAAHALDCARQRQPGAPEQQLPREQGAIQLLHRERSLRHGWNAASASASRASS